MPNAGDLTRATDLGLEIGESMETSDSGTFTAETVIHTVSASLISGVRYKIVMNTKLASSVAGDDAIARIREDSVSGTLMQDIRRDLVSTAIAEPYYLEARYTATSTGSKTFVGTGVRAAGTGNIRRVAAATFPSFLTVSRAM